MDDDTYVLGRNEGEYARLIEQAELMRPVTGRMLRAAGLTAGMHVLDIGCGVGDVSFLVSTIVGASGSVVGVDLDPEALRVAEARRDSQGIANVTFRQGDAGSVGLDRPFDAAVGRFVLMFMAEPTAALRHFTANVRPGGIVAFHEWNGRVTGVSAARQPLLGSILDLVSATFERSGARMEMGAELHWRMRDAGLAPDPMPLAEIGMDMRDDTSGPRRWAEMTRSLLPKTRSSSTASPPMLRSRSTRLSVASATSSSPCRA